ncbi:MAG: DNA gyrase subunit A [Kiritimatiellaeota bacterium]|nr:DNA gyrase subunit A [Kiritimatiellota bacterium]
MSESSIAARDVAVGIEEIMHSAYLQYSLSVNVGRAIPDVRDGLKPGNRRILFAMRQLGLTKSHAYTKCAKVVGEVIGNYHPHGDQAVYDTLVRMAQDFSMRCPLIDGQGNFGSIDGDAPAAYRYTECRLERLAEELLADLDRDTVEMVPTFDETTSEPTVLPARFPNLLVNGATGIGVGMATNIPPHNLGEVIDATVYLIENPQATARELMQFLPGPDFPTGATLVGMRPIIDLYTTGHGILKLRGKATIEDKDGLERIIITEIPYAVNKETMVSRIAALANEKRIQGISGLTDESSSRTGIRIVINVKKTAMANVVLNQLYAHTQLETVFGAQFLVVDHNRPRTMNLPQLLQAYIDHRLEVVTRRTRFELRKAEDRAHIVEGLRIAVDNVDEVVRIIRSCRTRDEASVALMERFELSKRQTTAILDMRLHQLTGLAIEELDKEYGNLVERITSLKELLASREKLLGVIRDELLQVRDTYANPRRTEIQPSDNEFDIEDLIPRQPCVVTVSAAAYIKRVPLHEYRTQLRGGVGVIGMQTKEGDYVAHLLVAMTHDYILFFTNFGRMHWLKAYEIPEAGRTGRGKALVNLIQLDEGEYVRALIPIAEVDVPDRCVVMATRNGVVKKTELRAFRHLRRHPIRAIVLDEDDDLIEVRLTNGADEILLASADGRACRFREQDVRATGRVSRGVRGMRLRDRDGNPISTLVGMVVVDPEAMLLTVTAHGFGKCTRLGTGNAEADREIVGGYRLTHRGGKGIINIRLGEGDQVVSALQVNPGDEIIVCSVNGQIIRMAVDDIRVTGRNARGVRVVRLRGDDQVSAVSLVQKLDRIDSGGENGSTPEDEDTADGDAPPAADTPESPAPATPADGPENAV